MNNTTGITILGGGPAGLAAAYYARKHGLECTVLEAGPHIGGNCRTLRHGEFLFDTGAHRLHDTDPEITAEIRALLGDDIVRVESPSQIYYNGTFIDFPLSPYDVFTSLDIRTLASIAAEQFARLFRRSSATNFRDIAIGSYGPTLAGLFLLNYSEKLWGCSADRLSPSVAGRRLKGLNLRTFIVEALYGKRRKTEHIDGVFYYPKYGIGMIFDRVAQAIGTDRIRTECRVTGIRHNGKEICSVTLNGDTTIDVGEVVSSLPLPLLLRMMSPAPPKELLDIAGTMKFRHMVLCVLMLRRDRFSDNASIYFPAPHLPFTRVYESKNRSPFMAPKGMTSLVVELPCFRDDAVWNMEQQVLCTAVAGALEREGLLNAGDVAECTVVRIPFAYPVLETGFEEKAGRLLDYCAGFANLSVTGRSGQYRYLHIHDLFRSGKELAGVLQKKSRRNSCGPVQSDY